MLKRRTFLASAAATGLTLAAARAQQPDRPNPMPEELRQSLERDPTAPVLGNAQGNITLTEFFDYNCPYCRKVVPVIQRLISADPQLRVVYREIPVFGEGSWFAARASLASLRQGRYWQFHAALMGMRGRAEEPSVMRIARQIGLDEAQLRRDMEAASVAEHIETSQALADHMGLLGTPTFIAGDEALFGHQNLDDLQGLVARGRSALGV